MITKHITTPMWTKKDMYEVIEKHYATDSFLQPEIAAQWKDYENDYNNHGRFRSKRQHLLVTTGKHWK